MEKYVILHITKDDKFFDDVFARFESDLRLENYALLAVNKVSGYSFRRIKRTDKVTLVTSKGMKDELRGGDYNAVFFHSLTYEEYQWVPYIPKGKTVIWWMWGMDVYNSVRGMRPLIEIQLYKPATELALCELRKTGWGILKEMIKDASCLLSVFLRRKILGRIDYFQPVLPIEYKIMSGQIGFHAKEFYYPGSFDWNEKVSYSLKSSAGSVIVGHSQSPCDNHLDVWNDVKGFIPAKRRVFFPISYLGNQDYADYICKEIYSDQHELIFLREYLPKEEYFKLMEGCSYAIYGMMRQQAMGNVWFCISQGIKVFLYRDSIVYKYLKNAGYVVYSIEGIDDASFENPLTKEEVLQNARALNNEARYRGVISEKSIEELLRQMERDYK